MAQGSLQRMVARGARELVDADRVVSLERSELLEHAAVKSGANDRVSQVRPVYRAAFVQSAQWNDVYRPLLREVSSLRPDVRHRKQVVPGQPLLNRQTHVCDSGEVVRVDIARTDVDV